MRVASFGLLVATGCSVTSEIPAEAPAPTAKEAAVSALVPVARQRGGVRVIVGVKAPAALEGELEPYERAGQRAQIAEAERTATERLARAGTHVKSFATLPYVVLHVTGEDGLAALAADPEVVSIEPDEVVAPSLDASTTLVGARTAWASGYGGAGWAVAVLDTGVLKTHTHLAGKVISEACYSTTDAGAGSTSLCPGGVASSTAAGAAVNCSIGGCDHGTHVSAIATSSHATYGGVAHEASVVAVQVFSRFDSATYCGSSSPCVLAYSSDWIEGLERVLALSQSGVKIAAVNMSLGGGMNASACDASYPSSKAAIDQLASAGIATVIAAGNDGYTGAVGYPGCISSAVTVGATTKSDVVASYSNMASLVDVVAPGSSIVAAVSSSTTAVASHSGTSMAAPHVAGAFAVLRSARPTMTVAQGLAALQATGAPIKDLRSGGTVTKPRIAIANAIAALAGPAPCTRNAPAITVAQPAAVTAPTTVRYVAHVTNRDEGTCAGQAFDVAAAVPAGWTAPAASTTLAAGASADVAIDVTPPAEASDASTSLVFTATSATMTAFTASATATYEQQCGRAAPDLDVATLGPRTIAVHVKNHDAEACGASSRFRMVVTTPLALSPKDGEIVVDNAGEKVAELAIGDAPAGQYAVQVALADASGAPVADATLTVTINSDGDAGNPGADDSSLDLGCASTRGGGLGMALVALALVLRRRRR